MCKLALKWALVLHLVAFSPSLPGSQGRSAPPNFHRLASEAEQARTANRLDEAIVLYRRALSLRPRWAEGWWYLGTLLYDRDAYAKAAKAFEKAAALNPKVGTAFVMLGLCEFKLGRNDAALEHIQQGRRLGTTDGPQFRHVMLYHEGLLLLGKGEFERAQETLALVSREGAEDEDLRMALGMSVLRLRPSEVPPDDSRLRQVLRRAGRAEELAAQGKREKFEEAVREYETLTADFPEELNVHYAFGRFLIANRHPDPEKAVAAFQREIKNFPGHVLARLGIASVRASADPAGGLPYAEEAVRLNPHIPLGHYLLGSLLLHTDQTARAIAELETAQRHMPNDPRVYFALGRAYARANRKRDAERARAIFRRLTEGSREVESNGSDRRSETAREIPLN